MIHKIIPATNIGINSSPINSHAFQYFKENAGKNNNNNTINKPDIYLVIASINNLVFIYYTLNILSYLVFP